MFDHAFYASDLRKNLDDVAVGIAEEDGAVTERVIGERMRELDAPGFKHGCALHHQVRRDAERHLRRQRALRRRRIVEQPAARGQRQRIGPDAVLDPLVAQCALKRKLHHRSVEIAHRLHVAHEDDGIVDLPDLAEGIHCRILLTGRGRPYRYLSPE